MQIELEGGKHGKRETRQDATKVVQGEGVMARIGLEKQDGVVLENVLLLYPLIHHSLGCL